MSFIGLTQKSPTKHDNLIQTMLLSNEISNDSILFQIEGCEKKPLLLRSLNTFFRCLVLDSKTVSIPPEDITILDGS